jgi:hypothetical protein
VPSFIAIEKCKRVLPAQLIVVGDGVEVSSLNAQSATSLGSSYVNDTGIDGETVLTAVQCFTLAEIEARELTH